jgi:hypothetical protein
VNVSATDLVSELKLLRRGRGISVVQLSERLGPALRAVCHVAEDDDNAETRRKVMECLGDWAASLPEDLRTAVLAAFALHEQARNPFYQDRVRWIARELDRDDRTARRRIDEGIERIAELAVASTLESGPAEQGSPSRSWRTEELRVTLALDQPVPEFFEFRRIVAEADDIVELDLALTVTNSLKEGESVRDEDLKVDVFHGGRLTKRVMESSDRVGLALRLPFPLHRREQHEIALRCRADFRYPYFVCLPRHPVDVFDLHVRFPLPAPSEIVQLEKVFQEDARDKATKGVLLTPDASGEVHAQFRGLAPGFAYGVRWQPLDPGLPGPVS